MTCNILVVDDDDVAVEAFQRYLLKSGAQCPVVTAEDGAEALEILNATHQSKRIESPFVVLLDLNMPRMNGFEFLEAVRSNKQLQSTIVFVLSTSNAESDRSRAYSKNIAGYITKDNVGPRFSKVISMLTEFNAVITLPKLMTSI